MGMFKEFKEFAVKGNLVDIAVAFVMGAAFGKIVTSFIDGLVMPLVGLLTGGVNFNDQVYELKAATVDASGKAVNAVVIKYGEFITNLIDFVIVAFCMFLVIKAINRMKKEEPAPAPKPAEPSGTDKLLMESRDTLNKNNG